MIISYKHMAKHMMSKKKLPQKIKSNTISWILEICVTFRSHNFITGNEDKIYLRGSLILIYGKGTKSNQKKLLKETSFLIKSILFQSKVCYLLVVIFVMYHITVMINILSSMQFSNSTLTTNVSALLQQCLKVPSHPTPLLGKFSIVS